MKLHASAKITPHARRLLVRRVLEEGWSLAGVAKAGGLSRTCARRWIKRLECEGEHGLLDRSSRPKTTPRRTPTRLEALVLDLRRTRYQLTIARRARGH